MIRHFAALVILLMLAPAQAQEPASPGRDSAAISLYAFPLSTSSRSSCEIDISARSNVNHGFELISGTIELRRNASLDVTRFQFTEVPRYGPGATKLYFEGGCVPRMQLVILRVTLCIGDDGTAYNNCGTQMRGNLSAVGGDMPILFTGR